MKMFLLLILISFHELLATPVAQNYASYFNYNPQNPQYNRAPIRSRKIDTFDPAQQQQQKSCTDKFCTDFIEYPKDYIKSLNLTQFEHLFVDDFVDTLALRFDPDENGLCQSRQRLIHPKRGITESQVWLTIINNDDNKYRQGILIEECSTPNYPCDYSQNFPISVESKCKQSYVYRNLLAISPEGRPVMERFQFPSCCKCVVTVGHRNRMGSDSNEHQKPATEPPYIFSN